MKKLSILTALFAAITLTINVSSSCVFATSEFTELPQVADLAEAEDKEQKPVFYTEDGNPVYIAPAKPLTGFPVLAKEAEITSIPGYATDGEKEQEPVFYTEDGNPVFCEPIKPLTGFPVWAKEAEITPIHGYTIDGKKQEDTITRAEMVKILWDLAGCPVVNTVPDFSDVPADAWFAQAVAWAAESGVLQGYGNGIFGADDKITREQAAVMLCRFAGACVATDVRLDGVSEWAQSAMQWCLYESIICEDDIRAQDTVTSTEAAQMVFHLK